MRVSGSPPASRSREHWASAASCTKQLTRPSEMDRDDFVAAFGGIFEHSPWIAEGAHALELGPTHDTAMACTARWRGCFARRPKNSAWAC